MNIPMKITGLITEYNPLHNGHKYHIEEAKRLTGADYIIVVMSGNFVQRGAPAFLDKYKRTEMALLAGADIVFELPVCYATASAEHFAFGAVSLLHQLGIVDSICFGSECGNITSLTNIAQFLLEEPKEYQQELTKHLKQGMTYPVARMKAMEALLSSHNAELLSHPNNILGIEYIKALLKLNSHIKPVTIKRITSSYHSQTLGATDLNMTDSDINYTPKSEQPISSATAIRKALIEQEDITLLEHHLPKEAYQIMKESLHHTFPILEDDFSSLLYYKLQAENETTLTTYQDIPSDLASRIHGLSKGVYTLSELAQTIKTKQWTLTRINRSLLHILLDIKEDRFKQYLQNGGTQYARILGFKKHSSHLIRQITDLEQLPVITKLSHGKHLLTPLALQMLTEDINAAHLYNQIIYTKYRTTPKNEYQKGVIIID